ncbi:tetratricopeptide repeat-containing serine protease family protein [Alkalinema pantanalense CENA528]|uniref:tetratricopeptide repeat-containing S1 family peptidase n=1 Tax=Alkalinema pantanalense TaxID=1620705 RepID=UPI003D6F47C8
MDHRLVPGVLALLVGPGVTFGVMAPAQAFSIDRLNEIAQSVTVRIQADRPSSGVLIDRRGDLYTVLTTHHGVQVQDRYTVVTPDGKQYPVEWRSIQPLPNLDLALVQFRSSANYATAKLANYLPTAQQPLFISGFPAPSAAVSEQIRLFIPGQVVPTTQAIALAQNPFSQGYRVFYTNLAEAGMSGSPLFDLNGNVVAIHGRSEGEETFDPQLQEPRRLRLGYSSGILMRTLLQYQPRLSVQTKDTLPPAPTPVETAEMTKLLRNWVVTPAGAPSAMTWVNYSNTLYRLGRFSEALVAINRALELDFNTPQFWYFQGIILQAMQRPQEAVNAFDRATQLQPNFYRAWQAKALVFSQLGRSIEAIAALDQALQIDAQAYVALYLRARVLGQGLQQHQAALSDLDRALQLHPEFVEAWVLKGQVLQTLGKSAEALVAVNQALAIEPRDREAQALRASLRSQR